MLQNPIAETELILNPDGSVFHLHLKNENIADTVLLVGDPGRVAQIRRHFSRIETQIAHREFVTCTGFYKGKRITALSSGIGTDNIDIVLNELYAAVNIDLKTRLPNEAKRALKIIRIGTSGALQPDIAVASHVASAFGLGLDGLMRYYNYPFSQIENELSAAFSATCAWPAELAKPYFVQADEALLSEIGAGMTLGITATATGFYGPQGRNLLGGEAVLPINEMLQKVALGPWRITNFDMETTAIYGLGRLFGFACCTANTIIANRATKAFSKNVTRQVDDLIELVLSRL
jgi:uridine phosphorylase